MASKGKPFHIDAPPLEPVLLARYVETYLTTNSPKLAASAVGIQQQDALQLLRVDYIQHALKVAHAKLFEKSTATPARIVAEVENLALWDPAAVQGEDGCYLQLCEMPESVRRAISEVKIKELWDPETGAQIGRVVHVKFADKNKANETLMKKHGLLNEVVEVRVMTNEERRDKLTGFLSQIQAALVPVALLDALLSQPLPDDMRAQLMRCRDPELTP